MQSMMLILLLASAPGVLALRKGPAAAPAASPMAGPAPGPAEQMKVTVNCEFTIKNLDYDEVAEHEGAEEGVRQSIKKSIDLAAEMAIMGGPGPAGAPAPGPAAQPPAGPAPALVQMASIRKVNRTGAPAAGPAAGPASSPMASPAPGPSAPDNVDTFVSLSEGKRDAVQVDVHVHPPPEHFAAVDSAVKKVCKGPILANVLLNAEGIQWSEAPVIGDISVGVEHIKRWGLDCGPHVEDIINKFLVAYTRQQVPHALDDACHLFESKISFSGNNRITKHDRRACEKMTKKLMKKWNYGKGKVVSSDSNWCHDICESKMGKGHPMCHFGTNEGKNHPGPATFDHPGTN